MTKRVAIEMKHGALGGENSVLIIAFLQNLKAACDCCNINERAGFGLIRHFLTSTVDAVIKCRVALPTQTVMAQEGCLTSYFAVANFLLKLYATDDYIAVIDGDKR